jgi:2-C-methyl-D-erythritol 2,4-cyclodiphosphate synthase
VVIHALVDAILGAAGLGDIGEHFPDSDERWKGARSAVFLERAVRMAREAGFRPLNADVTVLAQRPRLGALKRRMAGHLGQLLGAEVNVKAGTNEGCDAIGRGTAIAAHAVVLLSRV